MGVLPDTGANSMLTGGADADSMLAEEGAGPYKVLLQSETYKKDVEEW